MDKRLYDVPMVIVCNRCGDKVHMDARVGRGAYKVYLETGKKPLRSDRLFGCDKCLTPEEQDALIERLCAQ